MLLENLRQIAENLSNLHQVPSQTRRELLKNGARVSAAAAAVALGLAACGSASSEDANSAAATPAPTETDHWKKMSPDAQALRLGMAASILNSAFANTQVEKLEFVARHFPDLPVADLQKAGWVAIKGLQQGANSFVLYNPDMDTFRKIIENTDVLDVEVRMTRASVAHSLGLSGNALDDYVKKVSIAGTNGRQFYAMETKYLGVNLDRALQTGLIRYEDVPAIAEELFDQMDALLKSQGIVNKDINTRNILLHVTKTGQRKVIIIDWAKHLQIKPGAHINEQIWQTSWHSFWKSLVIGIGNNYEERVRVLALLYKGLTTSEFKKITMKTLIGIVNSGAQRMVARGMAKTLEEAKGKLRKHLPSAFIFLGLMLTATEIRGLWDEYTWKSEVVSLSLDHDSLRDAFSEHGFHKSTIDKILANEVQLRESGVDGRFALPYIPISRGQLNLAKNWPTGTVKPLRITNHLGLTDTTPESPTIETGLYIKNGDNNKVGVYIMDDNGQLVDASQNSQLMLAQFRSLDGQPDIRMMEIWEARYVKSNKMEGIAMDKLVYAQPLPIDI